VVRVSEGEFEREVEAVRAEVKAVLRRHAARLKGKGWSEEDVSDAFEVVLDAIPYELDEVIGGA
jgi:DNA-binding protein Fis